eukprot:TRINITY_DN14174_c0_g1_i2.p1 TRINITY_DN14174_c0_g1~~TRINITY_DN14174_c0_g1_i2.p1  ORF type:complete len:190 (+),score=40.64 TRINITY_DN14174_c0_g1_i2:71-640(+)
MCIRDRHKPSQPPELKKVNSVVHLKREVIKLGPSTSIRKLKAKNGLRKDRQYDNGHFTLGGLGKKGEVESSCITPKNNNLERLRNFFSSSKKLPPAPKISNIIAKEKKQGKKVNAVVKEPNLVKSRNTNAAKYETCIRSNLCKNLISQFSRKELAEEDSDESDECKTVIEYACDNDYSLIYNSLNNIFV